MFRNRSEYDTRSSGFFLALNLKKKGRVEKPRERGEKNISLDGHFQPLFPDNDDSVCLVFIHFTFFSFLKRKKNSYRLKNLNCFSCFCFKERESILSFSVSVWLCNRDGP